MVESPQSKACTTPGGPSGRGSHFISAEGFTTKLFAEAFIGDLAFAASAPCASKAAATEKRTGNARVWIHLLNIIETPFNSGTDSISVIVFRPLRYDPNSIDARRGTQLLGLVHSREIVFEGGLAHRRE